MYRNWWKEALKWRNVNSFEKIIVKRGIKPNKFTFDTKSYFAFKNVSLSLMEQTLKHKFNYY